MFCKGNDGLGAASSSRLRLFGESDIGQKENWTDLGEARQKNPSASNIQAIQILCIMNETHRATRYPPQLSSCD